MVLIVYGQPQLRNSILCSERTKDPQLFFYWMNQVEFGTTSQYSHSLVSALEAVFRYIPDRTVETTVVVSTCSTIVSTEAIRSIENLLRSLAQVNAHFMLLCTPRIDALRQAWINAFGEDKLLIPSSESGSIASGRMEIYQGNCTHMEVKPTVTTDIKLYEIRWEEEKIIAHVRKIPLPNQAHHPDHPVWPDIVRMKAQVPEAKIKEHNLTGPLVQLSPHPKADRKGFDLFLQKVSAGNYACLELGADNFLCLVKPDAKGQSLVGFQCRAATRARPPPQAPNQPQYTRPH